MSIAFALLCRYAMPGVAELPAITLFFALFVIDCLLFWQWAF